MEKQDGIEKSLEAALTALKENVDRTFEYLDRYPDEIDNVSKMWCNVARQFVDYGIQKSQERNDESLFRKISKTFIFGK